MKSQQYAFLILISTIATASAQNLTGYLLNIGSNNTISGNNAIIGQYNSVRMAGSFSGIISADRSFLIGFGNGTLASDSIIVGQYNSSVYNEEYDGDTRSSATFGLMNQLTADNSLAVGTGNVITRTYTGQGGSAAWQKPTNTAVLGYGLINRFSNCTMVGKNNFWIEQSSPDSGPTPLFIVGNGASASNRSNALEVLTNGEVKVPGNIASGGVITCAPGGNIPMFTGN